MNVTQDLAVVNERNLSGSYIYDARSSSCSYQRMTRQHCHPSSQIQMYNKLFGTNFKYHEIPDLPCFIDSIGDDILVSISLFCNIKSFISLSRTCKHYNNIMKVNNNKNPKNNKNNHNNHKRINDYWYNHCKLICNDFKSKDQNYNYNYNYNVIYRELVIIFTDAIIAKYTVKLGETLDNCWELAYACMRDIPPLYMHMRYCFDTKRKCLRKMFDPMEWRKACSDQLLTAPRRLMVVDDTDVLTISYIADYDRIFRMKFFTDNVNYDSLSKLLSPNDMLCLPITLIPMIEKNKLHDYTIPIIDIIEHDLINLFEFCINKNFTHDRLQLKFDNRLIDQLDRKYLPKWVGRYNRTAHLSLFNVVCHHGSEKILHYLLKKIDYKNDQGNTIDERSLLVALRNEQFKIAKILIPLMKYTNHWGKSLNWLLTKSGECENNDKKKKIYTDIALLLIDNDCDINIINKKDASPLCIACGTLQFDIIKKLIQHPKIKHNIGTCRRYTGFALFEMIKQCKEAEFEDFKNLIEFIIDFGIKTNNETLKNILQVKDRNNTTALDSMIQVKFKPV